MNGVRKKIDYILKHNLAIQLLYKKIMGAFFRFVGFFIKTDNKLILFCGHGRKYNDSPRTIYEYMIRQEKYKDLKYVWALEEPNEVEIPGCTKIKSDTLRYFLIALKAKYWVTCVNIERGLRFKKKKTIYLNTWHGTPLKTIGNAASGRQDFDFSNIDIFCCAGEYEKEIFIRDFNVPKESIIFSGLPRNDELYNVTEEQIREYRKDLNIPKGKKVILYAPTWRDSIDNGQSYAMKPPIDISYWKEHLQDEFVMLLRTHAYTNKLLGIEFNDFVRDFTNYPSINHLLAIADILLSDYSATIFDYSILGRPIICFGYDYDEYSKERGLYVDLMLEMPSGVLRTQEEVVEKLKNINYEAESKKTILFKKKYLEAGGRATEECAVALVR